MNELIKAADINAMPQTRHVHQFNDRAIRHVRTLSQHTGLARIGIHLVRLESGCYSTEFHYHDADEEFIYVLEGRGTAHIGDATYAVGPGDFMGFTAPSEPHSLHNPHAEDLLYLMGGERNLPDIVHYPNIKRTMVKTTGRRVWTDTANLSDEIPQR